MGRSHFQQRSQEQGSFNTFSYYIYTALNKTEALLVISEIDTFHWLLFSIFAEAHFHLCIFFHLISQKYINVKPEAEEPSHDAVPCLPGCLRLHLCRVQHAAHSTQVTSRLCLHIVLCTWIKNWFNFSYL